MLRISRLKEGRVVVRNPKIKGPESHDFHDSSLIDFLVSPSLDSVSVVLSTPDEHSVQSLWLIECQGVLRLEYETVGDGTHGDTPTPIEIYDVYLDHSSDEYKRWFERIELLAEGRPRMKKVFNLVFASSFISGWGKNKDLEGINIICRNVSVRPAPRKYYGLEHSQLTIPAAGD